jgi:hypothetical protein
MIVVEYSTDDYGKVMEYVSCIEKKAKAIKEIFEDSTMDQRSRHKQYEDEDDYYDARYSMRGGKRMGGRYV